MYKPTPIEEVRARYQTRAYALLGNVADAFYRDGWGGTGRVVDTTHTQFSYTQYVEHADGRRLAINFEILEVIPEMLHNYARSSQRNLPGDGIAFVIRVNEEGGTFVATVSPHYNTPAEWLRPKDARALETRFCELEKFDYAGLVAKFAPRTERSGK